MSMVDGWAHPFFSGNLAACPWCGAPYAYPRAWYGILSPQPQPTCRCASGFVWISRTVTTTTTHEPGGAGAPVPDQTDDEAIRTLEEKVDHLTLELARLRREREGA